MEAPFGGSANGASPPGVDLKTRIFIAVGMLRSLHSLDMVKSAAAVQCIPEALHTLEYSRVLVYASGHIIAGLVTITWAHCLV